MTKSAKTPYVKRKLYPFSTLDEPRTPWMMQFALKVRQLVEQRDARALFKQRIDEWSAYYTEKYGVPEVDEESGEISWPGRKPKGGPLIHVPLIPLSGTRRLNLAAKYAIVAALHDYALAMHESWIGPYLLHASPYYVVMAHRDVARLNETNLFDLQLLLDHISRDLEDLNIQPAGDQAAQRQAPRRRGNVLADIESLTTEVERLLNEERERRRTAADLNEAPAAQKKMTQKELAKLAELTDYQVSRLFRDKSEGGKRVSTLFKQLNDLRVFGEFRREPARPRPRANLHKCPSCGDRHSFRCDEPTCAQPDDQRCPECHGNKVHDLIQRPGTRSSSVIRRADYEAA